MAIEIKSGNDGNIAGVTSDNKLKVFSTAETEFHANTDDGKSFSWSNATYNYAAADTILLVKNTNSAELLHIEKIYVSGDTATLVHIHLPTTEVTPTGTSVTGINLNTSSQAVAQATAIADETNNTQGDIIWSGEIPADTVQEINFDGAVHIANTKSIGVDFVSAGTSANVTILGFYGA